MSAIRNHPKTVIGGAVVGVLALAGAAIAAVLLSSSITGSVSASSATASDKLTDVRISENDLACNAEIGLGADTITFSAAADEVVTNDSTASGSDSNDDLAGACTVEVDLVNTGEVPLYINDLDYSDQLPHGWKFVNPNLPNGEIAVNEKVTFAVTLEATNSAAPKGQFKASVVTSTSNS